MKETSHTTVTGVKMEKGVQGDLWQSVKFSADLEGFEKGTPSDPKGLEWEIRLYNKIKLIEFHSPPEKMNSPLLFSRRSKSLDRQT